MEISLFDYELPSGQIARYPCEKRDESRMMVLDRRQQSIDHKTFKNLPEFFNPGDILVINKTRVIRARLLGKKAGGQTGVEVMLLRELEEGLWECLVRPGRRLHVGARVLFNNGVECEVMSRTNFGGRTVRFNTGEDLMQVLEEIGHIPLPPYIDRPDDNAFDGERYQTVYAEVPGSVAAPTAGLHFTSEMIGKLKSKGVRIVPLILHVGLGTFQPVKVEKIEDHKMHCEAYSIPAETADVVNDARKDGRRIIAVGTTATRALETSAQEDGRVHSGSGDSELFIYPGYKFKIVEALLTNFHLPRSTLLMMVSAFAGREYILSAYSRAIREGYRFYSYGDCMLIL